MAAARVVYSLPGRAASGLLICLHGCRAGCLLAASSARELRPEHFTNGDRRQLKTKLEDFCPRRLPVTIVACRVNARLVPFLADALNGGHRVLGLAFGLFDAQRCLFLGVLQLERIAMLSNRQ